MQMPKTTAEQQARDMLERIGVPDAQSYAASDLVELANLISERARAALAAEPQGPTDEELGDLLWEFTTSTGHSERLDAMGFVRAALARYGRQP